MTLIFPPHSVLSEDRPDAPLIFQATAPVDYLAAVEFMENYVARLIANEAREAIWFLEHPEIYTAGSSAKLEDMLDPGDIPVLETGRGGKHTYHGPGQLVMYAMIQLNKRNLGVKEYVCALENIVINSLKEIGVIGERRENRIGIWICPRDENGVIVKEEKIAAIGVRVRRGVAFHGLALNLNVKLERFRQIVPCGIREFGVTSLEQIGANADKAAIIEVIKRNILL